MAKTKDQKQKERREYAKRYREENKEKLKLKREENKEQLTEYYKKWREENKSYYNEYMKTYKENNPHIKEYQKEYLKSYRKEYEQNRRKTNSFYKLITNIRSRTFKAIKHYNLSKTSSTMKMLECDKKTLLEWLQWSGETWNSEFDIENFNGDEYHIDHVKTFKDVELGIYTLDEVCHYTNLQILPADINLSKGSNSW